jgi:lipopolysaccharide/colanic/teichoic acid biosynthesis glycosyltransferase
VLLAPLMAAAAVLVKATSSGPIFFRQVRVGHKGRLFTMYKFRTIRADADATLHQQYVEHFIEAGAHRPDGHDGVCKMVDDPRVTRVGRLLRRTSVDEVPQFWNVLRGDMSLVGPRPAVLYEVVRYKPWHMRRIFDAKPGMTGLWQVNGRSRTSFDDMVRLDLRYARSRTILADLRILLATPRAVLSCRGAH